MKWIIQLEEWALFTLCAFAFYHLDVPFKWFWILLLTPDISAIGYILGNKIGAICYNIVHHKALAIAIIIIGWYNLNQQLAGFGLILLAHSSIDRALGYGFKYFSGFQHTHLGKIGRQK
jgi:hypothetical protein